MRRLVLLALPFVLAACGGRSSTIGDAGHGERLIEYYGCGACHTIPGVTGADARIGPSLAHFDKARFIAGALPNDVDDLVRWIHDPQSVRPGTLMPKLGVTEQEARDIAAYLYSHT
jgi:cytochrome c1